MKADAFELVSGTSGKLVAFDVVDPVTLEPYEGPLDRPLALMISVQFGEGDDGVLLIDQMEVSP